MASPGGRRRAQLIGVAAGVFFGAVLALVSATTAYPEGPWWVSALIGAFAGTGFGVAAGFAVPRQERLLWEVAGADLSRPQFRQAARASLSGRVPEDPRLRQAATRVAVYRLAQHRRPRTSTIVILGAGLGLGLTGSLLSGLTGYPLTLIAAGFLVLSLAWTLYEPVRLRRAILRLHEEP
ncbi:hypothetical protein [Amycolatopsis sp. PS_44_ISF1]|uniref:hypothetical protein n=1 Tax=Amycolatopsis sp. PS_44_ISF1 TaxID=2974917 RepID=UPI0028DD5A42|nr:hypothetical protein [Amycolatopsis sp. PS_44_ISF1]MDT8913114.1 hypothetical protein [Amycolatopsis sp. PS_44_ISF1]